MSLYPCRSRLHLLPPTATGAGGSAGACCTRVRLDRVVFWTSTRSAGLTRSRGEIRCTWSPLLRSGLFCLLVSRWRACIKLTLPALACWLPSCLEFVFHVLIDILSIPTCRSSPPRSIKKWHLTSGCKDDFPRHQNIILRYVSLELQFRMGSRETNNGFKGSYRRPPMKLNAPLLSTFSSRSYYSADPSKRTCSDSETLSPVLGSISTLPPQQTVQRSHFFNGILRQLRHRPILGIHNIPIVGDPPGCHFTPTTTSLGNPLSQHHPSVLGT